MANNNTLKKVQDIVSTHFSISKKEVTEESHLINDLGADSLDLLDIKTELEDTFDVSIPEDDVEEILLIKDVVSYIESK